MWSPKSTEADQVGQGLEQPGLVGDNLMVLSNPNHPVIAAKTLCTVHTCACNPLFFQ